MKKLILLLLVSCSLSCSEELDPKPYTYTQIFTGENKKTWAIRFIEETLNGEVIDRFSIGCAEDDLYTFINDFEHSFEIRTGNEKCYDPAEDAIIEDTWSYAIGSSTLTMIMPFFTPDVGLPFIVRHVEKNKMELEIFFDSNTASYRIHFILVDEE